MVAGVLVALATLTRPVGFILVVPMAIYLLARRVGVRPMAVLAGAVAFPVLGYALWFHAVWRPFNITSFDGYWLYGRVAPFADCADLSLPPPEARLCDPRPPSQRPSPNFYVWSMDSPGRYVTPPPGETRNAMLLDFSQRVIEQEPLAYASAVGHDLAQFLIPGRSTGRGQYPIHFWQFPQKFPNPVKYRTRSSATSGRPLVPWWIARWRSSFATIRGLPI